MKSNENIWEGFVVKVEDLFVTGYNLPTSLHVVAIEKIGDKLSQWKDKTDSSSSADLLITSATELAELSQVSPDSKTASASEESSEPEKPSTAVPKRTPRQRKRTSKEFSPPVPRKKRSRNEQTAKNAEKSTENVSSRKKRREKKENSKPAENSPDAETDVPKTVAVKLEVADPDESTVENTKTASQSGTPRQCPLCFKTFSSRSGYSYHEQKHEKHSSPCDYCPFIGINNKQLYDHIENVHKGNDNALLHVQGIKKDNDANARGQKSNKKETFKCNQCGKTFNYMRNLRSHLEFHKNGSLQCPHCPKSFQSAAGYKTHLNLHDGENVFPCDQCGYVAGNRSMVNAHIRQVHRRYKKHLCDVCGRGFMTNAQMARHRQTVHFREEVRDRFSCPHCSHKTHDPAALKAHIKNLHTERQGFMCNICGVLLKYKHSLIDHQRRHYSQKTFQCHDCNYTGVCEKDVKNHAMRMHRAPDVKCEVCGKLFRQKCHLERHRVVHTGEKKFACTMCSYVCNVKGNLRKHLMKTHRINKRIRPIICKVDSKDDSPLVNSLDASDHTSHGDAAEVITPVKEPDVIKTDERHCKAPAQAIAPHSETQDMPQDAVNIEHTSQSDGVLQDIIRSYRVLTIPQEVAHQNNLTAAVTAPVKDGHRTIQEQCHVTIAQDQSHVTIPHDQSHVTIPHDQSHVTFSEMGNYMNVSGTGRHVTVLDKHHHMIIPEEGGHVTISQEGSRVSFPETCGNVVHNVSQEEICTSVIDDGVVVYEVPVINH